MPAPNQEATTGGCPYDDFDRGDVRRNKSDCFFPAAEIIRPNRNRRRTMAETNIADTLGFPLRDHRVTPFVSLPARQRYPSNFTS